jgi:hypothetical protein
MPILSQPCTAHSTGSSITVSVEGVQATVPPQLTPDSTRHPSDVEKHKQVLLHQAPSVSESEERCEDVVSVVATASTLHEKETGDPFLVVWDECDKANPMVCPSN